MFEYVWVGVCVCARASVNLVACAQPIQMYTIEGGNGDQQLN